MSPRVESSVGVLPPRLTLRRRVGLSLEEGKIKSVLASECFGLELLFRTAHPALTAVILVELILAITMVELECFG